MFLVVIIVSGLKGRGERFAIYTGEVPRSFQCLPGGRRVNTATRPPRSILGGVRVTALLLVVASLPLGAAARKWQTGTWGDVTVKRQIVDFGPGASGFGRPTTTPQMRALADRRHFVIETDEMRIEAEDMVSIGRRSFDAVTGASVTFAIDKKSVYVRADDGTEHKLRLVKKVERDAVKR